MLSTVTRQAPSLSLQTFQEISGETLLLQAQGFQRSPLALASPHPAGFGTEGREREGRLAEQPGRAEATEDAAQERRAEMLAASRWAPLAAGQVWGNPSPLRGPQGRKSRVATSAAAVPKRQLCCGAGGGRRLYFPCSLTFSKNFPSRSSMGREKPRRPGRLSNPAGRAAPGGNSPPRAALGSAAGAQRLRTEGPGPRLLPELGQLMVGRVRPPRCPRAALRCAGRLRPWQRQARL